MPPPTIVGGTFPWPGDYSAYHPSNEKLVARHCPRYRQLPKKMSAPYGQYSLNLWNTFNHKNLDR